MNNLTDFDLYQGQDEIEEVARKIQQANPGMTWHQAWIKACRLLSQAQ